MTTLALIHGFLGTVDDWTDVRRRLDHSSVAIDVPSAPDWNSGIQSVTTKLPDQSILVGYSMGARIAMGCALNEPQRYRALVLVSGNPGLGDDQRDARWKHDQRICAELREIPVEQFLRCWYRQEVFSSLTETQVDSLVHNKRDLDARHFSELLACYSIAKQPNFWGRLDELAMPVVLVAGKHDPKYVDISREMHRRIPNGRSYLVEEAGHIVHRECPEQFTAILNRLVTELSKENALG